MSNLSNVLGVEEEQVFYDGYFPRKFKVVGDYIYHYNPKRKKWEILTDAVKSYVLIANSHKIRIEGD